jgi:hypothetical protein
VQNSRKIGLLVLALLATSAAFAVVTEETALITVVLKNKMRRPGSTFSVGTYDSAEAHFDLMTTANQCLGKLAAAVTKMKIAPAYVSTCRGRAARYHLSVELKSPTTAEELQKFDPKTDDSYGRMAKHDPKLFKTFIQAKQIDGSLVFSAVSVALECETTPKPQTSKGQTFAAKMKAPIAIETLPCIAASQAKVTDSVANAMQVGFGAALAQQIPEAKVGESTTGGDSRSERNTTGNKTIPPEASAPAVANPPGTQPAQVRDSQ